MVDTIHISNSQIVTYVNTFKTCDIDPILGRVTAPLVMGVYTTDGTKIVFRDTRSPKIKRQFIHSCEDFQFANFYASDDGPATRSIGAIATPELFKITGKGNFKFNTATMTASDCTV